MKTQYLKARLHDLIVQIILGSVRTFIRWDFSLFSTSTTLCCSALNDYLKWDRNVGRRGHVQFTPSYILAR